MQTLFTTNSVNTPEEPPIYRPDPVKRRKSIKAKIIDFITYGNPHKLTIQLWRLPENGGYDEIEINDPIVNEDNDTFTITDIDYDIPAVKIALSDIFSGVVNISCPKQTQGNNSNKSVNNKYAA